MMNIDQEFPYYSIEVDEAIKKLDSNQEGISDKEAQERVKEFGQNVLEERGKTSVLKLIIKQFKDFLILILFIAAIISFFTGHMIDVYVIIGVILFNAIVGFLQEYKAEKSISSLKKLIKKEAVVKRDGQKKIIQASQLVPGDVMIVEEGQSIPADGRIINQKNLQVEESSLTGESLPVEKIIEPVEEKTSLADRKNMIYKGTHATRGSCTAVVTATSSYTELGKIAESLQEVEEKESEFKKKTGELAKIMAGVAIFTSLIVFLVGYFIRGFEFNEILLVTIANLVSAVPEGLPAVLSIVLAIGANRMAKQNAIIREFTATETAGSLNVVLTDKTGTITQSILTANKLYMTDGKHYEVSGNGYSTQGDIQSDGQKINVQSNKLLAKMTAIAEYCNNASLNGNGNDDDGVSGDPTEVGLLVLAKKTRLKETEPYDKLKLLDDLPFNSEQKFRASLLQYPDKHKEVFVVGAPEKLLKISSGYLMDDGREELTDQKKKEISDKINELTSQSMRVIGCAFRKAKESTKTVEPETASDLVFAGLFGIIDPPRPEVKEAVRKCKSAGIRVVMVTGDHKQTAAAIAREVGILDHGNEENECPAVLTENELEELDDETFNKYAGCVNVFARVSPNMKLRIAKSIQGKDKLIGMTGDGVNDAPALKVADVGIAMGQRGTDVARDVSQIVLSDDNFASIVNAIKEGRLVFRNVRLTSFFLLTTNFAFTLTIVLALAFGFTYPLLATQILWVNLVTNGIMDVAIATEPDHGDIMENSPSPKGEPILNKQLFPFLLLIVPVMVTLALLTFNYYQDSGVEMARTGVFLVVSMTQIFNAYNLRSLDKSAFSIGIFKNKWVNRAFILGIILQIGVIKLEFMRDLFRFTDVPWLDIAVITVLSSLVFVFGELYKFIMNRVKSQ